MSVVTKAELARNFEISRARVAQYCAAGLPTRDDGRLNFEEAVAWIAKNVPALNSTEDFGARRAGRLNRKLSEKRNHSNVPPPGYELIARQKSPFAQGALIAAKEIVGRVGAIAAVMSVECGATCATAYRLESAVTVAMMIEISQMFHRLEIGPFADTPQANFWEHPGESTVNWPHLASLAGEPVNIEAWQAHAHNRSTSSHEGA